MPSYSDFALIEYSDLIEHVQKIFNNINKASDEEYFYNQILFFEVLKNKIEHSLILLSPYEREKYHDLKKSLNGPLTPNESTLARELINEMISMLDYSMSKSLSRAKYEDIKKNKSSAVNPNDGNHFNIIINNKKIKLNKNNYFHMSDLRNSHNITNEILDPIVEMATYADAVSIYDAHLDKTNAIELILEPLFMKISESKRDSISIKIHTSKDKKILEAREGYIKSRFKEVVKNEDTSIYIYIYDCNAYRKMFHGRFLQVKIDNINIVTYVEKYLSTILDVNDKNINDIDKLYIPPIIVRLKSKNLSNAFYPITTIKCRHDT